MIKNGCVPDAKDVNKVFLISYFNNLFQALENGETPYIGKGSYKDFGIYYYSHKEGASGFDSENSTCFYFDKLIMVAELYDDFEDGSVNTEKWGTTTTYHTSVTEHDGLLDLFLNNTCRDVNGNPALAEAHTLFDFKNQSSSAIFNVSASLGGYYVSIKISVSDGSNEVSLFSSNVSFNTKDFEVYFDKVNNRCKYRMKEENSVEWGSWSEWYDLSSLTKWNLYFKIYNNTSYKDTGHLYVHSFYKVSSHLSQAFVTENIHFNKEYSSFIAYADPTLENGVVSSIGYSQNNSSGYYTPEGYDLFVATSDQIKLKITVNTLYPDRPAYFHGYGVLALS